MHPGLIEEHVPALVQGLSRESSDAVKRNMLAIIQEFAVPEALEGKLLDFCFTVLNDASEPVAIKVFSMNVIYNLTRKYPELQHELADSIQMQLPYGTPGFKNRGEKILKMLTQL
jgi:hypothetical protein